MFPPYQTLLVDVTDRVATLTLRNGERNGWSVVVQTELYDSLRRCDADAGVGAVVLTGAGGVFSVGAEMSTGRLGDDGRTVDGSLDDRPFLPKDVRKPVVAALNGDAVGGGSSFPLTCDVRLLAQGARMGFVFVRRGVFTEYGASWALPRMIGLSAAAELLVTGRVFPAEEALALGVVHRVLPADQVLDEARRLAAELAERTAPLSVAAMKRVLWGDPPAGFDEALALESGWFGWLARQPDAREGVASFLEKRPPAWSGDLSLLPDDPTGGAPAGRPPASGS